MFTFYALTCDFLLICDTSTTFVIILLIVAYFGSINLNCTIVKIIVKRAPVCAICVKCKLCQMHRASHNDSLACLDLMLG